METTPYAKKKLYEQMRAYAGAMGYITDQQMKDTVTRHGIMTDLISRFESVHGAIADMPTYDAVMMAWEQYLTPKQGDKGRNDNRQTLTLQVTVNYGAVSLTIGITDDFVVPDQATRHAIMRHLRGQIDDLHREQARNIQQAIPQQSAQSNGGTTTIKVDKLVVSNDKGKKIVRVVGGQWTKHGVAVYPEVLEAAGIVFDQLQYGEHEMGQEATVLLADNGNPKKVLELIV